LPFFIVYSNWYYSLFLSTLRRLLVDGINNLLSSDSTDRNSAVQFETNPIHGFAPYFIYSRKKQMPVFKGQLFISVSKTLYKQIPANLVPDILFNNFDFCPVFVSRVIETFLFSGGGKITFLSYFIKSAQQQILFRCDFLLTDRLKDAAEQTEKSPQQIYAAFHCIESFLPAVAQSRKYRLISV
jgi:hypothetical protein